VLATLKELQLAMLNVNLFTLCSAHVSALVVVLSDSPCERIRKWDLSDFERGQICAFSWSICDKTATLLSASRVKVSKVMSSYTNHGKTTSAKWDSRRKSTLTERDCRTLRRIV
jgi:hypothetical protein